MSIRAWVDRNETVYIRRGDAGAYQVVIVDGEVSQRYTLPADAEHVDLSPAARTH